MLRTALGQKLLSAGTGIVLLGTAIALQLNQVSWFDQLVTRLDGVFFDLRLKATLPRKLPLDDTVAIVAIDESSLAEFGQWPWTRDKLAQILDRLFEAGALVVGFDIIFAEAQRNSIDILIDRSGGREKLGTALHDQLIELSSKLDDDSTFAAAMENRDVVLGYLFHNDASRVANALPPPLSIASDATWDRNQIRAYPGYTPVIPRLRDASTGHGFLSTTRDVDGTLRRSPLVLRFNNELYPSLALEMARLYLVLEQIGVTTAQTGDQQSPENLNLGSISAPIDAMGNAIIPYRGPSPTFPIISAADILQNRADMSVFHNKLVIVGATALGLNDVVSTPVQSDYPGVEVHASLLSGILHGTLPKEPIWAKGANIAVTLAAGLVLAIALPWLGPLSIAMIAVLTLVGLLAVNAWFWQVQHFVLQLALPLSVIIVLVIWNLTFGFLNESRQRNRIAAVFGQYVPRTLVDQMLTSRESFSMDGESRTMTVMFADIREFTTISEKLDPDELKRFLNQFFQEMTQVIFERQGTIDKYVGDMIMAFWGAPLRSENHASLAIQAALGMLNRLAPLNAKLAAQGLPSANIGIGINSGIMNVGDMGSPYRRAYTVIGDSVNLGSRLEGLTKYYGVSLVVGENTAQLAPEFAYRPLDRVRVKGKSNAVVVYEPVCESSEVTPILETQLQIHRQALQHFYNRNWDAAEHYFQTLCAKHSETKLYSLYLERVRALRSNPPDAAWDGVYERRSK